MLLLCCCPKHKGEFIGQSTNIYGITIITLSRKELNQKYRKMT